MVIKPSKASVLYFLLAIVATGTIAFGQLTSPRTLPSHSLVLEEVAGLQASTDTQDNSLSYSAAKDNFPLQGLKVEEIKLGLNLRLRPTYDLFSLALLLIGSENESFQPKALSFCDKPLGLSAPIYIFFRQLLL